MSGHSKWHNIQAKKGKTDAARARVFTKLGREISVAAKGNPNPDTNSKLADAIAKAKANNMPNDNITRSVWSLVLKIIITVATAIGGVFGIQSCM